jgi:CheY-like chemotaxis protein
VLDLVLAHDPVAGRRHPGAPRTGVGDVDAVAAGRLDLVLLDHDVVVAGADEDRRGRDEVGIRFDEPGPDPVRGQAEPGAAEDRGERHVVDTLVVLDQHVPLGLALVGEEDRTTAEGADDEGLARRHRPEIVLLDLQLPDVGGEEVLRRLKTDPATAELPVVVISADVDPEHIERVLAAGAREYLTKPLDVARFRAVVDSLLSGVPSR